MIVVSWNTNQVVLKFGNAYGTWPAWSASTGPSRHTTTSAT